MHSLAINSPRKIKQATPKIEAKLKINIQVKGKKAIVKGNELNEYIAIQILSAIDYGFNVEDALLLLDQEYSFKVINIKDHTKRKKLADVRARVIGTQGKAKQTLANLTNSKITIKNNEVAIISHAENVEALTQAVISLAQGAKHGNVFAYLEKQNRNLRYLDKDDLGLKGKFKKIEVE